MRRVGRHPEHNYLLNICSTYPTEWFSLLLLNYPVEKYTLNVECAIDFPNDLRTHKSLGDDARNNCDHMPEAI